MGGRREWREWLSKGSYDQININQRMSICSLKGLYLPNFSAFAQCFICQNIFLAYCFLQFPQELKQRERTGTEASRQLDRNVAGLRFAAQCVPLAGKPGNPETCEKH